MAYKFLRGDRDQPFLLPPDLRDWLPEGHLAWFILDAADQPGLDPFYRQHRDDGARASRLRPQDVARRAPLRLLPGRALLPQIERRLNEDIAFRVLAANQSPDHVTITRFRVCHERALAGFLVASFRLCAAAGMVRVGPAPGPALTRDGGVFRRFLDGFRYR
jgi:hypothetical protein